MKIYLSLLCTILTIAAVLEYGWLMAKSSLRLLPGRKGKLCAFIRVMLFAGTPQLPLWIGDENLLFLLAAFLLVFWFCYEAPRPAKLVVGIVFFLLLVPVNMILDTAICWENFGGLEDLAISAGKLLFVFLCWILIRRLTQEEKTLALPNRLWGMCALLSAAPLFMVLSFSIWGGIESSFMDTEKLILAYTVLPFVALSAAALVIALTVLSRKQELEQTAQLAQMRELYYEGLQSRETQVRTLRHDLSNHLTTLLGLLERGEPDKARSYLAQLTASPALYGTNRVCENELANVVLTCKLDEMKRLGLMPDVLVTLPAELWVADTDLCALLGNALDNAIEAAQKAQDKQITVRARADRGMLMLRVENGFDARPAAEQGVYPTTKADPANHGFGIYGMREIATRCGGTLETTVREKRFELIACLPLRGEQPVKN